MTRKAPFIKDECFILLEEMANQGKAQAMNDCAGLLLLNGNFEKAVSLFEKAEKQGNKMAGSNLRRIEKFRKNQLKS